MSRSNLGRITPQSIKDEIKEVFRILIETSDWDMTSLERNILYSRLYQEERERQIMCANYDIDEEAVLSHEEEFEEVLCEFSDIIHFYLLEAKSMTKDELTEAFTFAMENFKDNK